MKRYLNLLMILILVVVSSTSNVYGEGEVEATHTSSMIYVNDNQKYIEGYNINGSNYFKLRDLAHALDSTSSQFNVVWNSQQGQMEIIRGIEYQGEGPSYIYYQPSARGETAYPNNSPILIDGKKINVSAYNVKNNNYIKLRDLGEVIPFEIEWVEKENSIYITSALPEGTYKAISNASTNDNSIFTKFTNTPHRKTSFLIENSDGTITVVDVNDRVNIERYTKDYQLIDTKSIEFELPLFGSFYSGEKYNFIAYGQMNKEEIDQQEVIRIVKYDKNFKRLDSVSVTGGESVTTIPFSSANGRMAENGNELVFHTSRRRYLTPDGLNHQSQLTMIIDTDTMTIMNDLGKFQPNHVSHSFDQFVIFDGDSHVLLDHGDGYPRAITIHKSDYQNEYTQVDLFDIAGMVGINFTGVTMGGFEMSSRSYIAAFNSIDHSIKGTYTHYGKTGLNIDERDVYLSIVPKDQLVKSAVKEIKLTNYVGTDRYASVPKLVKISDDKLMVLWQEIIWLKDGMHQFLLGDLKYVMIDGSGQLIGQANTIKSSFLTDCDPILLGDRVVWYKNKSKNRFFYSIPVN